MQIGRSRGLLFGDEDFLLLCIYPFFLREVRGWPIRFLPGF